MQYLAVLTSFVLPLFASILLYINHAKGLEEEQRSVSLFSNRATYSIATSSEPLLPTTTSTVPALPVDWQAASCALDLSDQLLGGVKEACSGKDIDRKRCCPVLAAWLMAARAKIALQEPVPQGPGMPLLPDDSMVCVATMKAALEARGFYLTAPNSSCDVVICFCGIRLNEITMSSCPTKLFGSGGPQAKKGLQSRNASITLPSEPSNPNKTDSSIISSEPLQPSSNVTSVPPSLQALKSNCSDHSYKGCTKCLAALRMVEGPHSRKGGSNKSAKAIDCELMGLMWLLATNKTFYIPTVSAVLRALVYSGNSKSGAKCSPDWANMPLALDSSEVEISLANPSVLPGRWCCMSIFTMFLLALL